ncbi:hypothetical protein SLEP1_g53136 [Rubroshorea leprosula]|uniref:Uncharacterized protein n=1 Tax=Rubroshorea leprosula TaxID=152421 RepID=A0AAV5M8H3_9ROSI|nr:hypothetical protein SLEP1_g53136 [Rubroshorea leprosula]
MTQLNSTKGIQACSPRLQSFSMFVGLESMGGLVLASFLQ